MKIIRLADLTEKDLENYVDLRKEHNFPEPLKEYDEFGLRFPTSHLADIKGAISLLPLEYIADYVDQRTKARVDSNDLQWLRDNGPAERIITEDEFEQCNTTSVGNLGYIALHCRDEKIKTGALENLERYADWYLEKLRVEIENA